MQQGAAMTVRTSILLATAALVAMPCALAQDKGAAGAMAAGVCVVFPVCPQPLKSKLSSTRPSQNFFMICNYTTAGAGDQTGKKTGLHRSPVVTFYSRLKSITLSKSRYTVSPSA